MSNELVRERRGQVVADAGATSDWIERELGGATFKDERLGKRIRSLVYRLSTSPGAGIPLVCQDWATTKAAYRFLDNDRVSEAAILAGHFEATRGRSAATGGPLPILHDTTEFS